MNDDKKLKRGRKPIKDRTKIRKRVTIAMLPDVQIMASRIGDGNVSRGIEMSIKAQYKEMAK